MRSRTSTVLALAHIDAAVNPALAALIDYAAQNAGLDARNYFSDWRDTNGQRAYRAEARAIAKDWQRVKAAAIEAGAVGVTDAEIIEAAPRAFSGRLEWKLEPAHVTRTTSKGGKVTWEEQVGRWHYCTGQYFPTEYRKAVASVIEAATSAVKQARPAAERAVSTISELKALNAENGGHWFSRDSIRFFGTRFESGILKGNRFVTSEQPPHGPRTYSVRSFDAQGRVDTVGEFGGYKSKAEAMAAARAI